MDQVLGLAALFALAAALLIAGLTATLVWEARRPPRRTLGSALGRGLPADPGEMGIPFECWTLDRPGAQLPVWDLRPPRCDATAPRPGLTVVMVHGWGQSRYDLLGRLAPWDAWADRIVLYDRRGHGDASAGISPLGAGEERDLLELLDRLGPGPIVLAGHSMGAAIAIAAAAAGGTRGRVAGVVAYAPYLGLRASMAGQLRHRGLPTWPFPRLASAWMRLVGLRLLVVHGAMDLVAPAADGRRIAEAAARGTFLEVSGADHGDAHLVDAAGHERALRAFLERALAPPRPA
jgi:pimeloyl-ACP methyl ester carboxylesterase